MDPFMKIIETTFTSLSSFVQEVQGMGCLEKSSISFELHTDRIDDVAVFISYSSAFKKLCKTLQDVLEELDTAVFLSSNKIASSCSQDCAKNNGPTGLSFQDEERNPFTDDGNGAYKIKKLAALKNKMEMDMNQISSDCGTEYSLRHYTPQDYSAEELYNPQQDIQCSSLHQCPSTNLVIPFQNLAIDSAVEEPEISNVVGTSSAALMQPFATSALPSCSVEGLNERNQNFVTDGNLSLPSSFTTLNNNNYVQVTNDIMDAGSTEKCNKQAESPRLGKKGAKTLFSCAICSRAFKTQKHLSIHFNKLHNSCEEDKWTLSGTALPLYCCATCYSSTTDVASFLAHLCRPNDHSQSSLPKRSLILNTRQLQHLKKFICAACGIEFRSLQRITYHLPRCLPGPYPCNICSTNFHTRKQLNYHKKKEHRDEKSFACEECGKRFMRKSSLRKHCVNRHEVKAIVESSSTSQADVSFECDSCPKQFIKKIFLTNHKLRMHGLDKKFLCQVCDKKFLTNSSLSLHMDIHKGEKKFGCKYCEKKFRLKEKLLMHERIHTGERPFECGRCGKSFVSKTRLNEHVRRHDSEKRFPCPHCEKTYAAAFDLKKHSLKKHNFVMNSQCVKVTLKRLVGFENSTDQIGNDTLLNPRHKEQQLHLPQAHPLHSSSSLSGLVEGILQSPAESRQGTNALHHLAQVGQSLSDPGATSSSTAMQPSSEHMNVFAEALPEQRASIGFNQTGLQSQIVYQQHQPNHLQDFNNP